MLEYEWVYRGPSAEIGKKFASLVAIFMKMKGMKGGLNLFPIISP